MIYTSTPINGSRKVVKDKKIIHTSIPINGLRKVLKVEEQINMGNG